MGTSDIDGHQSENGDNADADEQESTSPLDDGFMQNVEDWGHSTRLCEDWGVYFRPVKYDDCKANAKASKVSEAKTTLQYVTKSPS